MIENAALQTILETATDLSVVCEIYESDAVPGADGFDPTDAIGCFAAVGDVTFKGVTYDRLVKQFGSINRKISKETNTATVDFSNLSGEIAAFEFDNGFEGLIMVIRLLSRSLSDSLAKTEILFTGRCEKPTSGNKNSLRVTATWILGGVEVTVPKRNYSREDPEGRVSTDPEFEGFAFMPATNTYTQTILLPFGFVWRRTRTYSSYSDLDASKPIPEVFGRAQLVGTHIAYEDIGTTIKFRAAFCQGEILDIQNARSLNASLPLSGADYAEAYGKVGALNLIGASWVGPGNYSRTAHIVGKVTGSGAGAAEPAPDIAAVILGRLMTIPDGSGDWTVDDEWTDNAAAHTRFMLSTPDYFDLDTNWFDDDSFTETYNYNAAYIIDRSLTDFIFVTPA